MTCCIPRAGKPPGGVWIGAEHPEPALVGCAVVQSPYRSRGGASGRVALIGPMRMTYATAQAAVRAVANCLERLLAEGPWPWP